MTNANENYNIDNVLDSIESNINSNNGDISDVKKNNDFTIKLVDIDIVQSWDKNPRQRDPERFEWIKISLRKFGFVTPIYVREGDNLIYSGHQRTGAAKEIGFTQVPVVYLPDFKNKHMERLLNVNFNLSTNDHIIKADFGEKLKYEIVNVIELIKKLPDIDDEHKFPIMNWKWCNPIDYIDQVGFGTHSAHSKKMADIFTNMGIFIPVVVSKDGTIVNGLNRIASAIGLNLLKYPVVHYTEDNHEYLKLMLNKISMSFDLYKVYGDELRYNSFFRTINQYAGRSILGVGFYHWVFKKEANKGGSKWLKQNLRELSGENRTRWIAEHGTTVIDFGAGRLDNTDKLQSVGIECIPFEPFVPKHGKDVVHFQSSRIICIKFLDWVSKKKPFTSLFCSSVFNSVPFYQDREYLMCIFQALCMWNARLYLTTLNERGVKHRLFTDNLNKTSQCDEAVLLDTEPGLMIGSFSHIDPKVQKYHSKKELIDVGKRYFYIVEYVEANGASHGIKCSGSRPINWAMLVDALEFEFNLPYPGNKRMGMQDKALEAFSNYCDKDLIKVRESMIKNGIYKKNKN